MPTRVLLVDDQPVMRGALRAYLATQPAVEVVGEAEDGRSAVALSDKLAPDVVVMDIRLPDFDGLEAARIIKRRRGQTGLVLLSGHIDPDLSAAARLVGASVLLAKLDVHKHLASAIATAASGA